MTTDSDLKVTITLTKEEAGAVQPILDELINIDLFKVLPYDSFMALEKFIKAVNTEKALLLKIKEMSISKDGCAFCNHELRDHTGRLDGTWFCTKESCKCLSFIETKVAK